MSRGGGDRDEIRVVVTLDDVGLPASLLRKGCNVLAFEVHRAPVRELFLQGSFGGKRYYRGDPSPWAHAALVGVRLVADPDAAILPNLDRPAGVQVWTRNATASKVEVTEYADPHEPIRPIRIVAARNGVFNGQVVVGSKQPIVGLQAAVSDLQRPGQRIPAQGIRAANPGVP